MLFLSAVGSTTQTLLKLNKKKKARSNPDAMEGQKSSQKEGAKESEQGVQRHRSNRVISIQAEEIFGPGTWVEKKRSSRVVSLDVETLGPGFQPDSSRKAF